eukprot:6180431-Pleurochrysis_carterae.AAC.2
MTVSMTESDCGYAVQMWDMTPKGRMSGGYYETRCAHVGVKMYDRGNGFGMATRPALLLRRAVWRSACTATPRLAATPRATPARRCFPRWTVCVGYTARVAAPILV